MRIKTPTFIFIFGGSGDLTQRKLIPALYNLYIDDYLPESFRIVSIGRTVFSTTAYRNHVKKGIQEFARREKELKKHWAEFSGNIKYAQLDLIADKTYKNFAARIRKAQDEWKEEPNVIYYMSVAPQLAPTIATQLHKHGIAGNSSKHRLVFEKPFGHDLQSARDLNALLRKMYAEEQIYRIDHFLGKETVQNILALRFANALLSRSGTTNTLITCRSLLPSR